MAVDSLADMEILFDGIPLGQGHHLDDHQLRGGDARRVLHLRRREAGRAARRSSRGTIQNDILKEYIAQKEWIFPPEPSMRLVVDMIEFCAAAAAALEPGLDLAATTSARPDRPPSQELAFTLADGFAYVEACIERGLDVDDFAPRLSFFFNAHNDFFEEIAKYRAARRIWAREMRERFGAKNPRSWLMRFHTQTAGVSLTAQQPEMQHRAHGARGARRGARRHAVAAHQLARRGPRAADREGGADRAAHAADHRPRDRRRRTRSTRSAAPTTSRT